MTRAGEEAEAMTTGANPLAHLSAELDELKAAHLYRPLRVMSTANGTRVTVDGRDVIIARLEQLPRAQHAPAARRGRRATRPAGSAPAPEPSARSPGR